MRPLHTLYSLLFTMLLLLGCVSPSASCMRQTAIPALPPIPYIEEDASHVDNGFLITPGGSLIRWKHSDLPLVIYVHPSAALWIYHVEKAASIWNRALGGQIFQVSGEFHEEAVAYLEESPGVIPVLSFDTDEVKKNPYTLIQADPQTGSFRASPVFMPDNPALAVSPDAYLLLVHELGHALGLAHDSQAQNGVPWSIMEPMMRIPIDTPPLITQDDLHRIREWYFAPIINTDTRTSTHTPSRRRSTLG